MRGALGKMVCEKYAEALAIEGENCTDSVSVGVSCLEVCDLIAHADEISGAHVYSHCLLEGHFILTQ